MELAAPADAEPSALRTVTTSVVVLSLAVHSPSSLTVALAAREAAESVELDTPVLDGPAVTVELANELEGTTLLEGTVELPAD